MPSFDKFLDEAANTADPTIRRGLLAKAEQSMLEDYPVIPLYFFVSKRLVKPYVLGVKPNLLDRIGSKKFRFFHTKVEPSPGAQIFDCA